MHVIKIFFLKTGVYFLSAGLLAGLTKKYPKILCLLRGTSDEKVS